MQMQMSVTTIGTRDPESCSVGDTKPITSRHAHFQSVDEHRTKIGLLEASKRGEGGCMKKSSS